MHEVLLYKPLAVVLVHTALPIPSGRFVRYSFSENITIKNSFTVVNYLYCKIMYYRSTSYGARVPRQTGRFVETTRRGSLAAGRVTFTSVGHRRACISHGVANMLDVIVVTSIWCVVISTL